MKIIERFFKQFFCEYHTYNIEIAKMEFFRGGKLYRTETTWECTNCGKRITIVKDGEVFFENEN